MAEKKATANCREHVSRMNKLNKDTNTFYVCAPQNIGDFIQYLSGLRRNMINGEMIELRKDRNRDYKAYKLLKVFDDTGKLIRIEKDDTV